MKKKLIVTSALLALIALEGSRASAQGYDPGENCWGIVRYPTLYVTAFCEGFFIDGPRNICTGVFNTGREVCYQGIDIGGGIHEICTGDRWQNWSQSGQYFDQGGSYGAYYRDFGCNVGTFGVYGQVQSGVQLYNGEITCDEASQRIGSGGVFQLAGARVMYVRAGPGGMCRQPIQQVPAHILARCQQWRGVPAQTPWEIANGVPGEIYISPACRSWNNGLWRACMDDAQNQPTIPGNPNPACAEGCLGPTGRPIVCRSGQPAVPGGGDWRPYPNNGPYPTHPSFYWQNNNPGGYQYYPCAMPRAMTCALRNGAQPPLTTTYGGVMCRGGNLFWRPPCPTCQSTWALNPNLLRPSFLRPAPPALGWPPGQNFPPLRPGGGNGFGGPGGFGGNGGFGGPGGFGGNGGFACCDDGFCGGGNVRPPNVDPPFEGNELQMAGCACSTSESRSAADPWMIFGFVFVVAYLFRRART